MAYEKPDLDLCQVETKDGDRYFGIQIHKPKMMELEEGVLTPSVLFSPEEATQIGLKLVQWAAIEKDRVRRVQRRRSRS